jgi:regulator of sigma E protease
VIEDLALFVAFGAILGVVVLIHELGHFAAARACRIRIRELGIGLPPRLVRLGSFLGAEISLNWIPLGGFVRPAGEFDASVSNGLAASPPMARIGVLSAGSLANLVLSVSLLTAAYVLGWPDQVEILAVEADSPAEAAGLLPADRILKAGGEPVREPGKLRDLLRRPLLILT